MASRPLTQAISDELFPRGGRPKLPPGAARNVQLWACVTEDESDQVFRRALRAGVSVSEYVRGALGFRSKENQSDA